jgi:peptidylprolyl isomerase
MCKNDSAQFIISALDFFEKTLTSVVPTYLSADGMMKVSINLLDIQTSDEYEYEQMAFKHWVEDLGEYEKTILKKYIREEKIDINPTEDGVYYIELQAGSGSVVAVGDTITTHYEGYFLNGMFFDSTRQRDEPLSFVYGQQWQVIPGLEKALGKMRKGEKALVIIPSEQAFGIDGSVLGIVPPFTPVVFEIELINVK